MGMFFKNTHNEKRRYIRINTVLPVEFRLISSQGKFLSDWIQGFSHDVGRAGIGLFTNILDAPIWQSLKTEGCLLLLRIHLPFSQAVITAEATAVWCREKGTKGEARFFIGVKFLKIAPKESASLLRFAYCRSVLPKLAAAVFIVVLLIFSFTFYQNQKMVKANKQSIQQLVEASLELDIKRDALNQNKAVLSMLQEKIENQNQEIKQIEKDLTFWKAEYMYLQEQKSTSQNQEWIHTIVTTKEKETQDKINRLQESLTKLEEENKMLNAKLQKTKNLTIGYKKDVRMAMHKKKPLEKVVIEDMYKWIKSHQNLRTGLIASFEGDSQISNWAFSYDQALCINVFLLFKDYKAAQRLINFYAQRAKLHKGGFLNAYYVQDGSACEYIVRSGPNIWLGLSILRYVEETKDTKYLSLVEKIAKFVLGLQDKEGGITGGPDVSWHATEHNLDAYAFFTGLYRFTQKKKYLLAKGQVENWLAKYSYTQDDIPINRGKGDSTIATDTYAWSISSLGPENLLTLDMDPEQIIEFAVKNCRVNTYFRRGSQKIAVEGFDFASSRNLARGGVISSEWSAQMILAFKVMAYFYERLDNRQMSNYYNDLASYYLGQLEKMIISSSSPTGQGKGCIPYASQDLVDTGHGWRTPKGMNTCSVSSTCYYIFAYLGYNPLDPLLVKPISLDNNE